MRGPATGLLVILLALGAAGRARACQVCLPFPKSSIADHLIEAESVVLAREDPKRPYHYEAIQVLKGSAPDTPLELFLDSGSRRVLKAYPDRSVLLAKAAKEKWRRLAMG